MSRATRHRHNLEVKGKNAGITNSWSRREQPNGIAVLAHPQVRLCIGPAEVLRRDFVARRVTEAVGKRSAARPDVATRDGRDA